MTIRWKLNLAVTALIFTFLVASGFAMHAVARNAEYTRIYSRMRQLGRFTSDIRTDIYHRLAVAKGAASPRHEPEAIGWPQYALDDIDIQINLSDDEIAKNHWHNVRQAIEDLGPLGQPHVQPAQLDNALRRAEHYLRTLRQLYSQREQEYIATAASTSLTAQVAIWIACVVTVVLFLVYLIMVRDWLVKPIEVLKASTDTIGDGNLKHRVPLNGHDELAQLARRFDIMADRLSVQQHELLEARELSAIGELCTNVAHGLRNPLASLRACAQLVARRADNAEHTRNLSRDIIQQADRMDERITQLFEFSQPGELRRQCTTFDELAKSAKAEVLALLKANDAELIVEDETQGTVWCLDRELIGIAMAELIANAIHHQAGGGCVRVRGWSEVSGNGNQRELKMQVVDQGSGISSATLAKAFDLFFTSRSEGSGMGLTMVRRSARRHRGDVELQSEVGKGTTATLTVPGFCDCLQGESLDEFHARRADPCKGCKGWFPPLTLGEPEHEPDQAPAGVDS